jgi:DNA-binding MarR family transcriptional regulator
MRLTRTLILALVIPVFLIPIAVADVTPVPVWPSSDMLNHDASHNLTTWFATSLNVPFDVHTSGQWSTPNQSHLPPGFQAQASYILPLLDGSVEARYLASGILKDIMLDGETPYTAQSDSASDLSEVTYQIATDLEINHSQAQFYQGIAVWFADMPRDEMLIIVRLEEPAVLGSPYSFNSLHVGFRSSDLRVVSVYATVWYSSSGEAGVSTSEAVTFSSLNVETDFDVRDASTSSYLVGIWNGTTFAYLIRTEWDVGSGSSYYLDEWVDVNTGDVLGREGPQSIIVDTGLPFDAWFWAILAIVGTSVVVGLAMFYRINSERALDHFTRGRIFGYLQANPGANYTMIRESLRLSNGTAAYHLWVLERLGFVRSVSKGRIKQFYPQGVSLSKGSLILTRLQYSILDLLEAEGELSQSDIARSLEMSRQRAHYNVKVLRSLELLEQTSDKKEKLSFRGEEIIADGEEGLFVSPSSEKEPSKEAS